MNFMDRQVHTTSIYARVETFIKESRVSNLVATDVHVGIAVWFTDVGPEIAAWFHCFNNGIPTCTSIVSLCT